MNFGPSIFERTLVSSERPQSQLDELSDSELVHKLRDNTSPECIAVLFGRYRPLILSICVKILRDACEAEDVCQDVILEIWSKAEKFDENRGTVKVWIIQLAYSKSLHRRRYLALRNLNTHSNYGNGNGNDRLEILEPSYFPDDDERLTMEKQVSIMTAAFSSLPPKQKQALQLIYFDGLSIREVAERTNETIENTRHYYYRGLKKLKEMISGSSVERAR